MNNDGAETTQAIANIMIARKAITDKEGKMRPKKDIYGVIKCPLCEHGDIDYSISSYNGHIHAHCTTVNCVSWME